MNVRERILTHATKLFAEQGYDGTSVQEIADAVGIRKPSLLYHFKSKDELRENVIAEMLNHWSALLPSLFLRATREERFEATMDALSQFFIADPDRARLILRETLDRPDHMRTLLAEFVRPWIGMLAEQLNRAKSQGTVRKDVDNEAYAVQVIAMAVSGTAVIDTLQTILPNHPVRGTTRERHVRELTRVARSSLYTDHDTKREHG